ncbi:hypothetical protein [Pyxidicoccus caerfyrddinensis]|uniref:hypothetical protein n=1 Tax=Pyxidicoccus caerfyrddinensis TaxID=2709663 RepID=UPI001F07CC11|nr:hypothetical protein [Pyxidicoccus caerfyrddinensis]
MSLRRTLLTAVLASTALLSACTLRPRYKDVVAPGPTASVAGQTVALRVVNTETNQPVPGARVLAGDSRSRLSAVTDTEGLVTLQVSPELLKENPLFEVVLPAGVKSYRLQLMPSGQSPAPEGTPATPEAPATPVSPETPATPESPATPATPASPESPATPATPATPTGPSAGT